MIDLRNLPISTEADPIILGLLAGYQLAAPKSFWMADPDQVSGLVNGCGPGGFGDRLVPDTVWGLSIKPACKILDWMYLVYNCEAGFDLSNDVFRDNMNRINLEKSGNRFIWALRNKRIMKYYWACHYCGRLFYYDAHVGVYHDDEVYV